MAIGETTNRLCSSGLQALNSAANTMWSGQGDVLIAGGVESMTRSPVVMLKTAQGVPRGGPIRPTPHSAGASRIRTLWPMDIP